MGRAEEEKLFLFMFGEELIGVGHAEQRIRICLEFFTCADADFFFFPKDGIKTLRVQPRELQDWKRELAEPK